MGNQLLAPTPQHTLVLLGEKANTLLWQQSSSAPSAPCTSNPHQKSHKVMILEPKPPTHCLFLFATDFDGLPFPQVVCLRVFLQAPIPKCDPTPEDPWSLSGLQPVVAS